MTRANQRAEIQKREIVLAQAIRAAATLEVVRLNEELARTAFDLAQVEYDRGLIDSFELRNAQISLEQAQLDVLEEQFRIASALIDLEFSINAEL